MVNKSATERNLPHFIRTTGKCFLRISAQNWPKVGRLHLEHDGMLEAPRWCWSRRYEGVMEIRRGLVQCGRVRVPVDRVWRKSRT